MATLNRITGLVSGQYGTSIPLTIVDDEGTGIDISAYTSIIVKAHSPDARTVLSFSSTGGDTAGNFSILPSSGNTFDRDGTWIGQVQLGATGILDMTVIFDMEVDKLL